MRKLFLDDQLRCGQFTSAECGQINRRMQYMINWLSNVINEHMTPKEAFQNTPIILGVQGTIPHKENKLPTNYDYGGSSISLDDLNDFNEYFNSNSSSGCPLESNGPSYSFYDYLAETSSTNATSTLPVCTPWMEIAEQERLSGVTEIEGNSNNPRIIEYHSHTLLNAQTDEIAWCSSFMNYVADQVQVPATHDALAKSWLYYGRPLSRFEYGAFTVLQSICTLQYHVGFAIYETSSYVTILGGNQGDPGTVKYSNFYKRSFRIKYYLPPGY